MTREYNRHGREQDKVVQVTCDAAIEPEFLATMRQEGIRKLPDTYDPTKLTYDPPERGEELQILESDHAKQIAAQWRSSASASYLPSTRRHFSHTHRCSRPTQERDYSSPTNTSTRDLRTKNATHRWSQREPTSRSLHQQRRKKRQKRTATGKRDTAQRAKTCLV